MRVSLPTKNSCVCSDSPLVSKSTNFYLVFDEMTINFNMFCHVMMDRVVHNTDVVTNNFIGSSTLSFNSLMILLTQTSSQTPFAIVLYSVSPLLRATTVCFLLRQVTKFLYTIVQYPDVDFLSDISSPICISECVYLSIIMFGKK